MWRCEAGCHTLRPQLPDAVYFDAHHKLMATHHVLWDAKQDMIIGESLQKIWHGQNQKTVRQIGESSFLCLEEFSESECPVHSLAETQFENVLLSHFPVSSPDQPKVLLCMGGLAR
jgi:hypothetical protein